MSRLYLILLVCFSFLASLSFSLVACGPASNTKPASEHRLEQAATEKNTSDGGSQELPSPPKLAQEYILSSKDSYPEGITFDPVTRAFYVGSLKHGDLTRIDVAGKETSFVTLDAPGSSTLGMKVDVERRWLWVCSRIVKKEQSADTIRVFHLDTGKEVQAFPLSQVNPKARCNDLALGKNGNAYITDPSAPNIYEIAIASKQVKIVATDPVIKPPVPGLGLNGIVVTPDQKYLLAALYITGKLFRISLNQPTEVTEVKLSGDSFSTPDGMIFLEKKLYAVNGQKIHQVSFSGRAYAEGNVKSIPFVAGLSTATVAEGQLFVIKSEVNAYVLKSKPNLPFKILRVDLASF